MINLPDNLQELQYVCLNLREDFIAAKVQRRTFVALFPLSQIWLVYKGG